MLPNTVILPTVHMESKTAASLLRSPCSSGRVE